MINFIKGNRIIGWNSPPKEILQKLKHITPNNQFDIYERPNWVWESYPEGDPIYSPQPYTPEQTEQLRKEWCQTQIRRKYSSDDESKILRECLATGDREKFNIYNQVVEDIKSSSYLIDFNVAKG